MGVRTAVAAAVAAIAILGTAGSAAADGEPLVGSGVTGLRTGNPPAVGSDDYTTSYPPSLFDLLSPK